MISGDENPAGENAPVRPRPNGESVSTPPADGVAVLVASVTKRFVSQRGRGEVIALEDVSFNVREGEFLSLVGESGCGKSTLLKMAAGLVQPDNGDVSISGSPARAGRRDVGIMLQTPALLPWKTVAQNVALPFALAKESSDDTHAACQEMIAVVGLGGFEDAYPWQLSGGMQQRVSLARLLAYRPAIKLMDEPFGALDELNRERLNLELTRIHEQGRHTILFVTHSVNEAVLLSDRIVVLTSRPGRVAGEVEVQLPRPRVADLVGTHEYGEAIRAVRALLRQPER